MKEEPQTEDGTITNISTTRTAKNAVQQEVGEGEAELRKEGEVTMSERSQSIILSKTVR